MSEHMREFMVLLPLVAVTVGGLALMLVDAFNGPADDKEHRSTGELALITAVVLFLTAGISLAMWMGGMPTLAEGSWVTKYFAVDKMSLFFDVVIAGGSGLAVLLAGGYLREHEIDRGEFYPLILFTALGAMVLGRSIDLISIFVGLETMSLGTYALVAFRRTNPRAAEAATKYFLLGSFAAAVLLFGSALLYGATGHTDLAGIGAAIKEGTADSRLVLVAVALIVCGLGFKVSAVPFHQWTPDAYEGANTPTTVFMSVVVKAAAFAALVRIAFGAFTDPGLSDVRTGWPAFIAILAALSMVYGNVAAIAQTSVKRMLAYSSIAHAGFILVGFAAAPKAGPIAHSSILFYTLAYTVSNVLAFGALIALGSRGREATSFEDLAGAGRRHPWVALPFVVGVLSLMGLPPTAGFFAKYYVLSAAVEGGMLWLAVLGVVTSVVAAYYYLKVIVFLFMKDPKEGAPIAIPMRSGSVIAALVIAGYFVVKIGVTPSKYLEFATSAASSLVS